MSNIIDISYKISSEIHGFSSESRTKFDNICKIGETCAVNVSQINISTHVGTHIDAPSHYIANGTTIDQLALEVFIGGCIVIEVKDSSHITSEHIKHEILTNASFKCSLFPIRVLFKTGSTDLYRAFPKEFPSITRECIEYLSSVHQVVLIGVDTPSIDPVLSKDLQAHHACYEYGISIIEGLDLEQVAPGFYTLIALPLKLQGLDASPVRAALIKNFDV